MLRPGVTARSGYVQGAFERGVAAFRGIPFAKSPIGELRYAAPEPHPGWTDVRIARRSGPSVPQGPSRLEAVMGPRTPDWDEDGCLTVNVWTPGLPGDKSALPVLLWFHGGGFTSGSGGWDWYDGGRLAAAGDIVVVTANYRVGPLGYLYLPEHGVENLGVQDQAAALDWVRDNIAAFGGDPADITVGGQSAGAFSALYLAVSPVTGPHITKVIAQSGPFGLVPQSPEEATEHARDYLDILGLRGHPNPLAALRALPAERLLTAYQQLAQSLAARPGNIAPPMYPVLGVPGMPTTWQQALKDGRLDGKRLLTGTTRNEMTSFFAFDPRIQALSAAQARTIASGQTNDGAERFDRALAHSETPAEAFTELETELVFRDDTLAIADHHATAGETAFVYRFDYTPPEDPAHLGAAHCAELPFFFDTLDAYPDSPMLGAPTTEARALADTFSRAAATFVATGQPDLGQWPAYKADTPSTIQHFA